MFCNGKYPTVKEAKWMADTFDRAKANAQKSTENQIYKMAQYRYLLSLLNDTYIDWNRVSIDKKPTNLVLNICTDIVPDFDKPLPEETETTTAEKAIISIAYGNDVKIIFDKIDGYWTAPIQFAVDTLDEEIIINILELLEFMELKGDTEARKKYNKFVHAVTEKLLGFTQNFLTALQVQEFIKANR